MKLIQEQNISHLFEVDSAGTHAYHVNEPPDQRSQEAAIRHGIDLSALRSRHVTHKDFEYYDYILAMDRDNYYILLQDSPPKYTAKIHLFLEYAPQLLIQEVPDPYYGGMDGFEYVFNILEAAARGLLTELHQTVLRPSGK